MAEHAQRVPQCGGCSDRTGQSAAPVTRNGVGCGNCFASKAESQALSYSASLPSSSVLTVIVLNPPAAAARISADMIRRRIIW